MTLLPPLNGPNKNQSSYPQLSNQGQMSFLTTLGNQHYGQRCASYMPEPSFATQNGLYNCGTHMRGYGPLKPSTSFGCNHPDAENPYLFLC